MKIAIAVSKRDLPLAVAQSKLILQLGGLHAHSCLLILAPELAGLDTELSDNLKAAFPNFERHLLKGGIREPSDNDIKDHPQPHVIPANQMFQATWRHLIATGNQEEVYWLEPDCVPLHNRWADELARDYLTAQAFKKYFMGVFVPKVDIVRNGDGTFSPRLVNGETHMVGTGIYPPDIRKHSGLWSQAKAVPFDALMQWETSRAGYPTDKILHNHATKEYKLVEALTPEHPATLTCEVINEWGISTDKLVIPITALVVHGCKDTSLIDLVSSGKLFVAPTKNKVEETTPKKTTAPKTKSKSTKKSGFTIEE